MARQPAKAPVGPGIKDPPEDAVVTPDEAPPVPEPTADQLAAAAVFEDEAAKRPVIVKLARIMSDLPTLEPAGRNDFHKYNYITDKQVNGVIRPRMARERLMVIPDVLEESWVETKTKNGGISWVTKLKVRFTVIDGDSGDSTSGTGIGYGDDTGDKGANKALTAAMKYWLIKLFQIGGEDDLEADHRADERAHERQSAGRTTEVNVTGSNVEGVARGGQQDRITKAQLSQLLALYRDLGLDGAGLALRIDQYLGDKVEIGEDADASAALNAYLRRLSGDDAGKLISALVDEKDQLPPSEPDGADGTGY